MKAKTAYNSGLPGRRLLVEGIVILEDVLLENNTEDGTSKALTVVAGGMDEIHGVVDIKY